MKVIYKFSLMLVCVFLGAYGAYAQADHDHQHQRNEIGVNTGAMYMIDDEKWGMGVHLHYFRALGDHSRWSIGGFVEQTLLADNHFSFGFGAKFQLIEKLYLSAMPAIVLGKHNHGHDHEEHTDHIHSEKTKAKFAVHTELVYTLFEWNKFHMGPALDYSWSKDDSHMMFGIHAAIDF